MQQQRVACQWAVWRRVLLLGCLGGMCAAGLRLIDAAALGQLTASADADRPAPDDPTPILPSDADVPDELVCLNRNGTLYVPLRAALRLVDGEPVGRAPTEGVRTISGVGLVEFEIGSSRCAFNGRPRDLRAPAILESGTTYIAARDFAEVYEVPVSMGDEGRTVTFAIHGRAVTARPESELYRIDIDRSGRRLLLYFRDRLAGEFPVCVGSDGATPLGDFRVANKAKWPAWRSIYTRQLVPGGRRNPLGARWIGLTAWGDRGHAIGIHGTNSPSCIGQAVSAGCIRMHNEDVITVYGKVSVGTPVHIRETVHATGTQALTQANMR